MALIRQLEQEEWDLLSIVEDPILLGEFLRNTSDGSPNKEEWPKQSFKYRWYQKDLLTDKSEFISLVAGRAVGKCSPLFSRIYTFPYGYMTVRDLLARKKQKNQVVVYALNDNKELVQRRATLSNNGEKEVFRVTTAQGHIFDGTANHPILTERGYIEIQDLDIEDDRVAITTFLPHDSVKSAYDWEELRWLGYSAGAPRVGPEMTYPLKYQKQIVDFQKISEYFDAHLRRTYDGSYQLMRKRGPLKHYGNKIIEDLGIGNLQFIGFRRIPYEVKAETLDNLRVFLEAYFSLYADFTATTITTKHHQKTFVYDLQELLLRFGVESKVSALEDEHWGLTIDNYYSYYTFFDELDIPGVTTKNLKLPTRPVQPTEFLRFDDIVSIESRGRLLTYALYVHDTHNYISDNVFVHNSLVLEDRLIYQSVNVDTCFPATKESTLVTANVSQMTPILDRLVMRLSNSMLLKDFLKGNINRSKGTLDFPQPGGNYRLNARIAGSRGENNMVGLHVPKIVGDEMQLFPMSAFVQLGPTYNSWEPECSQFYCGVPNGLREGNVLYFMDQRSAKFKKYRIPAHQNPFFSYSDNIEALKQYGGEDSDDYRHLVLGEHGEPAFSIIPRDKIITEPIEFWTHRYSQTDKHAGRNFRNVLALHRLPETKAQIKVLAIDTGYSDPTVAQVIGQDKHGIWRTFVRYRLTRIPFPEQAEIINWLDDYYNFSMLCVDLGAGGGGIGLTQDLQSGRYPKSKKYDKRIHGVTFNSYIESGETSSGMPLKFQAKSFAGQELARLITEGQFIFSELDMEGISQMERVAYQRRADGTNQYFIMSDKAAGKSNDDHIFASYIVFVLTLLTAMFERPKRKLASARWI